MWIMKKLRDYWFKESPHLLWLFSIWEECGFCYRHLRIETWGGSDGKRKTRVQELRGVLPLPVWPRQHPGSSVNFWSSHFKRDIDKLVSEAFRAIPYKLYGKVGRLFSLKKNDLAKHVSGIFMYYKAVWKGLSWLSSWPLGDQWEVVSASEGAEYSPSLQVRRFHGRILWERCQCRSEA